IFIIIPNTPPPPPFFFSQNWLTNFSLWSEE
ncbi:MAG: hypothetical protein ACI8RD_014268, partial [Bacillariaceae sp.]